MDVLVYIQDDDGDEDFEPSPVEDDDEGEEEAGVRRRNIQSRELNDLLQDAYKQVLYFMSLSENMFFCTGVYGLADQPESHLMSAGIRLVSKLPDSVHSPRQRRSWRLMALSKRSEVHLR